MSHPREEGKETPPSSQSLGIENTRKSRGCPGAGMIMVAKDVRGGTETNTGTIEAIMRGSTRSVPGAKIRRSSRWS